MKRIKKVCGRCGSQDVLKDAYAQWDEKLQNWVLLAVYDNMVCNACGAEDHVDDKEIEEQTAGNAESAFGIRVACPHCQSTRIGHVQRTLTTREVTRFSRNTETGELEAEAFTGEAKPDLQTADAVDFPWRCMDCDAEMVDDDLVVTEA